MIIIPFNPYFYNCLYKYPTLYIDLNTTPFLQSQLNPVFIRSVAPVGTRGELSRMCPPYPLARRKRRIKGGAAVSRNNRKEVGPVSVLGRAR